MFKIIKQDITEVKEGMIVHGCNAQGVMASGVAIQLRNMYPDIFNPYENSCSNEEDKGRLLGTITSKVVRIFPKLIIVNAITQINYGRSSQVYASLGAIRKALFGVEQLAASTGIEKIYLPKIGCGLGGLKWEKVEPYFNNISKNFQIIICEL